MKRLCLLGVATLLILSIAGCSLFSSFGDQTAKEWSINQAGLKSLIATTNQAKAEPYRLLQTIDRVEFPKNHGLKVYGTCQFSDGSTQEGEFGITLINQDSRVRMEINFGNACGIQQEDPRVAVLNNELSNALNEKIAADCGKVLVNWIRLSGNRLTVSYVETH